MDIREIVLLAKEFVGIEASVGGFGRRWVAVVGIDGYPTVRTGRVEVGPLDTAVSDARAVQEVLKKEYGFEALMEPLLNEEANPEGFKRLFRRMRDRDAVSGEDQLVVYFAGHGVEDGEGSKGFWIPYLEEAEDYEDYNEWISHSRVKRNLRDCAARQVLLVSDSCYAKKLTERSAAPNVEPGVEKDLLGIAGQVRIRAVLTSGSREPVLDRGGGGHSVFCNHFLDLLRKYPGKCLPIGDLMYAKLRNEVERSSERMGKRQTPRLGYLTDDTVPFLLFRGEGRGGETGIDEGPSGVMEEPLVEVIEEPVVGSVCVTCNVGDAEIRIGGKAFRSKEGVRQRLRNFPGGSHKVSVKKEGYQDWNGEVKVLEGGETSVDVRLEPERRTKKGESPRAEARKRGRPAEQKPLGEGKGGRKTVRERQKAAAKGRERKSAEGAKSDDRDEPQRFTKDSSGIITDTQTGLEWYVKDDKNTSWNQARRWADKLSVGGGGWRMPAREELRSLYEPGKGIRNLDPIFGITGWWVWSGETPDSSSAWYFSFSFGEEPSYPRGNSSLGRAFAVRSLKVQQKERYSPAANRDATVTKGGYKAREGGVEEAKTDTPPLDVRLEPPARFRKDSSGIITDTQMGLEWYVKDDRDTSWNEARSWAGSLSVGNGGWRLPTLKELRSLYERGVGLVNLDPQFRMTRWWVWSGRKRGFWSAWLFDFFRGEVFWGGRDVAVANRAFAVRSRK